MFSHDNLRTEPPVKGGAFHIFVRFLWEEQMGRLRSKVLFTISDLPRQMRSREELWDFHEKLAITWIHKNTVTLTDLNPGDDEGKHS